MGFFEFWSFCDESNKKGHTVFTDSETIHRMNHRGTKVQKECYHLFGEKINDLYAEY
jgi:hypothetical protein